MESTAARLIGVDWGGTRLRAFLIDEAGAVLDTRYSGQGADKLDGAHSFAAALSALCGDWHGLPQIACGVVGWRRGWQEMPYVPCPATIADVAARIVRVTNGPYLVPGVAQHGAHPDVMRGEETQIFGALSEAPHLNARCNFVLPGTHSKWVEVKDGLITSVSTHQSGELFALLRHHSVLNRLMPGEDQHRPAAFAAGVAAAREPDGRSFTQILFGVRARNLLDQLAPEDMADYLSGLLIGHEIAAGLAQRRDADAPLVLVGEPALCERYARALASFGVTPAAQMGNTAARGLWKLARELNLIG